MSSSTGGTRSSPPTSDVELLKQLWEEYRYRHHLIWELLFKVTTAAVILSATPFGINDLTRERAGEWVVWLPLVAAFLVLASFLPLRTENKRFQEVKKVYRPELHRLFGREIFGPTRDLFERFITAYLLLLLTGCLVVTLVVLEAFVLSS
jgi:hypothetical protein